MLARLIQYENFRLADLVIVNGLPRFLVRLARRASESILHGMVSELLRLWASRSLSWSASDIAPGRYYFVVVVDPENAIGAYRMHRSEFSI